MDKGNTRKWQLLAWLGLVVSLFFSLRYVGGYFMTSEVARELIIVSMTTLILFVGLGVAIVSTLAPRIEEYRTRPKTTK
jgi:hypothetical protein